MKVDILSRLFRGSEKTIFFIAAPLVLFIIYLSFFAVEKYRSESIYVIRDLSTKESMGVDLGIQVMHISEYLAGVGSNHNRA